MSSAPSPITYEDPDLLLKLNRECLENPSPQYPHFESPSEVVDFVALRLLKSLNPNEAMFTQFGKPRATMTLGNLLQRPPLDNHHLNWMSGLFTMQGKEYPRHCQIMERDMFRCLNRVGVHNIHKWCRIYFEDYNECYTHYKEIKRFRYLQRMLREKKMEPLPTPPYDSFWPRHA